MCASGCWPNRVSFGFTHTIPDNCVSTGFTFGSFETIMSPRLDSMRQWGTPMTVYGYARVSTTDQSLDIQIAALKAAGCDKIRSEMVSGTRQLPIFELPTMHGHSERHRLLLRDQSPIRVRPAAARATAV